MDLRGDFLKNERQLEIIIYLLNHSSVTSKQLAEKFEVSERTIMRDMDSISMAGVPIISNTGRNGGYSILEDYKIRNQFIRKDDFNIIIMALKSLNTGYKSDKLEYIIEKYLSLGGKQKQNVMLDFSVCGENQKIQFFNKQLESAIEHSSIIKFTYKNIQGISSEKIVEPLILRFQWYAWYLFAYDTEKKDFRTYKIARIENLIITDSYFSNNYDIQMILAEHDRNYSSLCEKIEIICRKDYISVVREYFPDSEVSVKDGKYKINFYVPTQERLWKALLLSLGDNVKIIAPEKYRLELIETAKKFISNYDTQMS